jgi:transposase-like protein
MTVPLQPERARRNSNERQETTPEQIVHKSGKRTGCSRGQERGPVAKEPGISEHTLDRWRNQYGGMKVDDAKELRRLKDKNGRLKRMVADQALDIETFKEVARGNF